MDWAGKRILITGGAGFIGSNLAERLVHLGAKVSLVDSMQPNTGANKFNLHHVRDKLSLHVHDVREVDAIQNLIQSNEFLFNLAGQNSHLDSMIDPFTDLEINSRAQLSVLEVCRHHNPNIKIIFTSTRQVYGKPAALPVSEGHPLNPVDINGVNKLSGEWFHILYHRVYGVRSAVLRLTNTYGPRMRVKDARQTFLGLWIKNVLSGEEISVYGNGNQLRDFNFVDDVIDALLLAATDSAADGKIYNLGSQEVLSLQEVAKLTIQLNGSGNFKLVEFPSDRKIIDIGDYQGDFRLAKKELNWSPKVQLKDGLKRTLEFYREFGNSYW